MLAQRRRLSGKSTLGKALQYALNRWDALARYVEDGRLSIDNNLAERQLRGIAVTRKNFLFLGSDAGGQRAAIIYTVAETAKLNGLDPEAYIAAVLDRLARGHPVSRLDELLPWNFKREAPSRVARLTLTLTLPPRLSLPVVPSGMGLSPGPGSPGMGGACGSKTYPASPLAAVNQPTPDALFLGRRRWLAASCRTRPHARCSAAGWWAQRASSRRLLGAGRRSLAFEQRALRAQGARHELGEGANAGRMAQVFVGEDPERGFHLGEGGPIRRRPAEASPR